MESKITINHAIPVVSEQPQNHQQLCCDKPDAPESKADAGHWVSVKERRPAKDDADQNGNVLAFGIIYRSWCSAGVESVEPRTFSHWMRPPPPPVPEKSAAELAWEKWIMTQGGEYMTPSCVTTFLAGYAAAQNKTV